MKQQVAVPGPRPRHMKSHATQVSIAAVLTPVLFALCAGIPLPAHSVAADATATSDAALEEIVVHARRRDERLADVPLAVTAISGVELADQSAVLFEDALREIPNTLAFKSARSSSALEVTMRGQSAIPSAIVYDPAVGLYIDGVYVANGQAAMGTLLDIDDIEVSRGAQGTLFGRNNTGGSIALYTHKPDLDAYSAELSASAGNMDLFAGRAILNVPLSDTLAVRFAYQNNQHQGWGSDVATGQTNFMNEHRNQMRFGATWQPTSDFDAYFTYERFSANEVGALLHPLPGTFSLLIPNNPPSIVPASFYQTDSGSPNHYDNALTEGYQLTLREHFSDALNAKLILGYRDLLATNNYDPGAEAVSIAEVTLRNTSYQKSGELQLSGTALDKMLDWVGGLYWFRDNGSVPSELAAQPALAVLESDPFANFPTTETNKAENDSVAGFLHAEYQLASDWSLAAGARRTQDKRSVEEDAFQDLSSLGMSAQSCTISATPGGPPLGLIPPGGPCPNIYREVEYNFWSWEGSLRHRINDDVTAYFRAGRAQRSGGWNLPLDSLQAAPFRPERLTDFELGIKAQFLGGRGAVNADVFTGNYADLQRLLAIIVNGTPVTEVINAGRARVGGLELESDFKVTDPFSLQATFGYTDAHYLQFSEQQVNGGTSATVDLSHNQFYMTPKFTASLAGTYEIPLADGRLRLHGDYTWRDAVQFNVINDFNSSGSVGLLSARLAYSSPGDTWEAALFGTNLLDKQYAYIGGTVLGPVPGIGIGPFASWQAAADRRLYGLELTYRFRVPRR
ncbi:MAG: TonB-dependent receptor [Steroidobacterales bacterium]